MSLLKLREPLELTMYRVLPEDISAIAASEVIAIPSDEWGEAVHAIVILKPGMQAGADEPMAFRHDLIAGFKCPRSIEFTTDPFPISGANKQRQVS